MILQKIISSIKLTKQTLGIISKHEIEKFDKKTNDAITIVETIHKKFHTASSILKNKKWINPY